MEEKALKDHLAIEINAELTAKIDVLIAENLYETKLDFIEKAIQNQLDLHQATFEHYKKKKAFAIGFLTYNASELEKIVAQGKKLEVKVIGGLSISEDVSVELAERAISKISLAGILRAPDPLLPFLNKKRYTILGRSYAERLEDKRSDNFLE